MTRSMYRTDQVHPRSRRIIRQVKVLEERGDKVLVRALHGELAGCEYEVSANQLRMPDDTEDRRS